MAESAPREKGLSLDTKRLSNSRFTYLLQAIVAFLGLVQSFLWRNTIDADGMSYIDVAYAYANGDWAGAINAYWSPLFSWLIAIVISVFNPSPAAEFPVIHALEFIIFLVVLFAFSFFVRELFAYFADWGEPGNHSDNRALLFLAYASFAFGSLVMQDLGRGGPDFLLCAAFYFAVGLMLRLARSSGASTPLLIAIGGVLGLGYLGKAMMFPLGLIMLACVAVMLRRKKRSWLSVTPAIIAFAVVTGPWIAVLSQSKGRLTYGDAGKLVYGWYVDEVQIRHPQFEGIHGTPTHPTRRLSDRPVIYEFAEPVRGTYPVWYDASYWFEGLKVNVRPRQQLRRLMLTAEDFLNQAPAYSRIEFERETWFYPALVALVALCFVAGAAAMKRVMAATWFVIVPIVGGFALYAVVLLIARYVSPFVAVGVTTVMVGAAAVMRPVAGEHKRAPAKIAVGLAAAFSLMTLSQLSFVDRRLAQGRPYLEIAERLHSYGVATGSRVGVIGDSMHAYWAHLARLRIVAEIMPGETASFWAQDPSRRAEQLEIFRKTGAVAVIADHVPSSADTTGWVPAGSSGYLAYLLQSPAATRPLPHSSR